MGLDDGVLWPGSLNVRSVVAVWSWASCCKPDNGSVGVVAEADVFAKEVELLLLLLSSADST